MIVEAVLFLIVVLVVLHPLVQQHRERALARRLQETRDPREAAALANAAAAENAGEGRTIRRLRQIFWPILFR